MSKPLKFRQLWTAKNITVPIALEMKRSKAKSIQALNVIGQRFIRDARNSGNYQDHTGNLRSSVGYAIFDNGKEVNSYFETANTDEGGKGKKEGKKLAKDVSTKKGLVLIVTAGMDYAYYVEARGFNVISIFAPEKSEVEKTLKFLLNG